jgi:hypothetical protein
MPVSMLKLNALRRAVRRLIKAELADAWKGAGDPANIPAIERELEKARSNYHSILRILEET